MAAMAVVLTMGMGIATPARAGIPVIDVANLAQAIQQVLSWVQQYSQMVDQYNQLVTTYNQIQQAYNSTVGGRGMEGLMNLSNLARNYLPPDAAEMANVISNTSSTYSGLAARVQSIKSSNGVLSAGQISGFATEAQRALNMGRDNAAGLQMLTEQAQQTSSSRYSQIQSLISSIGSATDQKAILDLQGRLQGELAMQNNDNAKLQAMYAQAQAQELQRQQTAREGAINSFGTFTTRLGQFP
jgi:type IV secretion system protein VirB5